MALNIGKSISYPQKDDAVWKKTAIGTALMCFSGLLIPLWIAQGYGMRILKDALDGKDETRLPDWKNVGDLLVQGFFAFLITLSCYLPGAVLGAVALIPKLGSRSRGGVTVAGLIQMPLTMAAMVLVVAGTVIVPIMLARYSRTGSLGAAFNFKEILSEMKRSLNDYVLLAGAIVLCQVGVAFVAKILYAIPIINLVAGILAVGLGFYCSMIFMHWTGRLYRAYFINVDSPESAVNPLTAGTTSSPSKTPAKASMRRLRDGGGPDEAEEEDA
ncbi:MAG: DUF4013 domain-containing protein [Candidatus Eremiobacterota bacterium]